MDELVGPQLEVVSRTPILGFLISTIELLTPTPEGHSYETMVILDLEDISPQWRGSILHHYSEGYYTSEEAREGHEGVILEILRDGENAWDYYSRLEG